MKLSKASYYWVLLIPIIVSLFRDFPSIITVVFQGENYTFDFTLPFKWYLLYLVGVFVSLGTLLYETICPALIKNFRNYTEYESAGYPPSYLMSLAKELGYKDEDDRRILQIYNLRIPTNYNSSNVFHNLPFDKRPSFEAIEASFREYEVLLFDELFILSNKSRAVSRYLATFFYLAAILILTWLFLKNTWFVINYYN
ncbi:MAG: hypothetical protein AAGA77_02530 [Bacteroidota bacterium]